MKHEQLTELEALEYMADLAADVSADECIVELGTHQGGSLVYLAGHSAHAYGVDAWGLRGAYRSPRMARYYNEGNMERTQALLDERDLTATLIRGFSTDVGAAWDGPKVGLLYVDAVHQEGNVLADVRAWYPHLTGWVCFDDYNDRYPGVVKAVDRLCRETLHWVELVGTRLAVTRVG